MERILDAGLLRDALLAIFRVRDPTAPGVGKFPRAFCRRRIGSSFSVGFYYFTYWRRKNKCLRAELRAYPILLVFVDAVGGRGLVADGLVRMTEGTSSWMRPLRLDAVQGLVALDGMRPAPGGEHVEHQRHAARREGQDGGGRKRRVACPLHVFDLHEGRVGQHGGSGGQNSAEKKIEEKSACGRNERPHPQSRRIFCIPRNGISVRTMTKSTAHQAVEEKQASDVSDIHSS